MRVLQETSSTALPYVDGMLRDKYHPQRSLLVQPKTFTPLMSYSSATRQIVRDESECQI